MKRTTRVKIMLILLFACLVYWLNSLQDNMPSELLPNTAPRDSQTGPDGAQEIWPTDNPGTPEASAD